jgi:predicted dehydrogenase
MSKAKSARNYSTASAKRTSFRAPLLPYQPPRPRKYRPQLALIGCGGITAIHLKAYREAGWKVTAFFDIDQSKAEKRRDEFFPKATVCRSLEEILENPKIEVIDIATHPAEREKLIEACLRAGKHVLSQKPFVLDLNIGRYLASLAKEKGVLLAVNQNGRWAPHFSYLRLAAQKGVLGHIGTVTTSVSWDHTCTKGTPFERMRHLLLYDFGIHWFDFVSQVFAGQRALEVVAYLECAKEQIVAPPLLGSVAIHFEHGVASLCFHGHSLGGQMDLTVVTGNEGVLFSHGRSLLEQKVHLQTLKGQASVNLKGNWFREGFQGTMGELLTAIEERRIPNNNAEDNLKSLELCFAAIQAAGVGRPQVPGKIQRAPAGCKPE